MREILLEKLVEPGTGSELSVVRGRFQDGRMQEGELASRLTGKRYPVLRGIPRFADEKNYASSFGLQWNRFRTVQIDSATHLSESRKRFDAEVGWAGDQLIDQWVLDAGCGAGRFAEICAQRGANLVALDLSGAVDAVAQTLARFDNVDVVQGDILNPPFPENAFDRAYSIGVVQHTSQPEQAVRSIVRCVKDGGAFAMTIYGRRPWTKLNAKYLLRPISRRVPPSWLVRSIEAVMPIAFPLTDVLFRLPVVGKVGRFVIPIANYPNRTEFTRAQRYQEAVLDTFDMLSPRYDQPMTWRQVEQSLRAENARSWAFRTRAPIVVSGLR